MTSFANFFEWKSWGWVLAALLLLAPAAIVLKRRWSSPARFPIVTVVAATAAVALGAWLVLAGLDLDRVVALACTSGAAYTAGAALAFVFSAHGEEEPTFGKVRDWLIGGVAALSLADVAQGGDFFRTALRSVGYPDYAAHYGTHNALAAVFFLVGFLQMFLWRELELNVELATERKKRSEVEEARRAAEPAIRTERREHPDERTERPAAAEARSPRPESLKRFATAVSEALNRGETLTAEQSWDGALALYYAGDHERAKTLLKHWENDPERGAEAAMKLARIAEEEGSPNEAASVLERAAARGLAARRPGLWKLLGYYLLWDEEGLSRSIEASERYLAVVPGDAGALLNVACAYAQLHGRGGDGSPGFREEALAKLEAAIRLEPSLRLRARELTAPGEDFYSLREDPKFLDLVGQSETGKEPRQK